MVWSFNDSSCVVSSSNLYSIWILCICVWFKIWFNLELLNYYLLFLRVLISSPVLATLQCIHPTSISKITSSLLWQRGTSLAGKVWRWNFPMWIRPALSERDLWDVWTASQRFFVWLVSSLVAVNLTLWGMLRALVLCYEGFTLMVSIDFMTCRDGNFWSW